MKIRSQIFLALAGFLFLLMGVLCICIPSPKLSIIMGVGSLIIGVIYMLVVAALVKTQKQIGKVGRAVGIGKKKDGEVEVKTDEPEAEV